MRICDAVGWGVDDLHLVYGYDGERAIGRVKALPYVETPYGRRLGSRTEFGKWENALGHYATFSERTNRLSVQLKLGAGGVLTRPENVAERVRMFEVAQAMRGLETFAEAMVRRIDVAVDLRTSPGTGRALIDAMGAVRLSGGRRVEVMGDPRSTVYFRPRTGRGVLARTYCRNLKTGNGEAYGLIRLEAQHRFEFGNAPLSDVAAPEKLRLLWVQRFGDDVVGATVRRVDREVQTMTLADLVEAGELTFAQMERLGTFLDLERLGRAREVYPPSVYARRRREAVSLGLSKSDVADAPLDLELGALLEPARRVWQEA